MFLVILGLFEIYLLIKVFEGLGLDWRYLALSFLLGVFKFARKEMNK